MAERYEMLNVLCPMHVVFDQDGIILHAGPTVQKLFSDWLIGKCFLDIFQIKRPREIADVEGLKQATAKKLNLWFYQSPHRQLKGIVMPGPGCDEFTMNLSFGISVVDAVQEYKLTAADFAATDLTLEMLYLVEAKSAAMEASKQLNLRLQSAREEAETQALTDTLTGLKNRRGMDQELVQMIANKDSFTLMHIDLDFFKAVNDTLGHAAGDFVLQKVGEIMKAETREGDTVARVGGDEFVILVKDTEDHALIEKLAARIISRLQIPMEFEGDVCRISGSVGSVIAGDYSELNADHLLGDADAALYAAKHAGRGCHRFFDQQMRQSA